MLNTTVSDSSRTWDRSGPKLSIEEYLGTTREYASCSIERSLTTNPSGSTLFQIPLNPKQSTSTSAPSFIESYDTSRTPQLKNLKTRTVNRDLRLKIDQAEFLGRRDFGAGN